MVSLLTNFTSNRMVVRLMIILAWLYATSQLRTGGWKADYPRLIVAWPVLVSHKTVSISALMVCCCAGLGMRHSPPRLARARCSLSDILGCSVPGLPGQSCLLPGGGRGETFVNKTVTWDRQLCQAGPG